MYFQTVLFLATVAFFTSVLAANSCQPGRLYFDTKNSDIIVKGITRTSYKLTVLTRTTHETTEENLERTLVLTYAAIKRCSQDEAQGRGSRTLRGQDLPANSQEARDFAQMGIRMIQNHFDIMTYTRPTWVDVMWSYRQQVFLIPLEVLINYAILKQLPEDEHEAFENKLRSRVKDMLHLKKSYLDDLWTGNDQGSFWQA